MLNALRQYYGACGISADHFHCKHQASCSAGHDGFVPAKEAYVGRAYEAGLLPRLLFLSLDSGSSEPQQTLEVVRLAEERRQIDRLPKGRHWYRTHQLALTLLRPFCTELTLERVRAHFAHTNSAKCCLNRPHRKQAADLLFANCRQFIPAELALLRPRILVTQGAKAREVLTSPPTPFPFAERSSRDGYKYRILSMGEHEVLWFHSYHPRNFGAFNRQRREEFDTWAAVAFEVLSSAT